MKFYLIFALLLCSFIAKSTTSTALASVEISHHHTPPVEKKKIKKKKSKKRPFKKAKQRQQLNYKKHFTTSLILTILFFLGIVLGIIVFFISSFLIALGALILAITLPGFIVFGLLTIFYAKKNQQKREQSIAKGLLISTIVFAIISFLVFLVSVFLFGYSSFFLIIGLILLGAALIFLIVFLIHNTKLQKQKESALKKSETELRAEVNYLEEKKILRYLSLHENLTSLKVQRNVALKTKRLATGAQRKEARLKIKDLDLQINIIKAQISELRRQNKINKVLESRK